ncbi:MAG: hypothetical protein KGH64_00610 [Candidatus Micrarchaeota archaeon]|nr:hypothetical protein [Candidatus Micrarchaeota archaeon]
MIETARLAKERGIAKYECWIIEDYAIICLANNVVRVEAESVMSQDQIVDYLSATMDRNEKKRQAR